MSLSSPLPNINVTLDKSAAKPVLTVVIVSAVYSVLFTVSYEADHQDQRPTFPDKKRDLNSYFAGLPRRGAACQVEATPWCLSQESQIQQFHPRFILL